MRRNFDKLNFYFSVAAQQWLVETRASREPALSEVEGFSRAGTPGAPLDQVQRWNPTSLRQAHLSPPHRPLASYRTWRVYQTLPGVSQLYPSPHAACVCDWLSISMSK